MISPATPPCGLALFSLSADVIFWKRLFRRLDTAIMYTWVYCLRHRSTLSRNAFTRTFFSRALVWGSLTRIVGGAGMFSFTSGSAAASMLSVGSTFLEASTLLRFCFVFLLVI